MSALSRQPLDVRWAITTSRLAKDEVQRQRIRAALPIGRAQMIADIRHGLDTADMIRRDIHDCRANRKANPIRWAIDAMRQADKVTMLQAQIEEIGGLLRELSVDAGRAAMP